jgi:glutamate racemase
MSRLGIIDWGIGGISLYRLIKAQRGRVPVTYFSDTGVTPYGKMTRSALVSRLNTVIGFLEERGVTHLVIGCNAASTALPFIDDHKMPVEGVIDAAVAEAVRHKPKRLGLIGGRRTVLSGVYREAFASHGITVKQRIAQPLSGLIESGDVASERLTIEASKILAPLRASSHILLACTHYPAIASVIKGLVSAETELIDPANALVERVSRWKIDARGKDEFLTTGSPGEMKRAARLAFGVTIDRVSSPTVRAGRTM